MAFLLSKSNLASQFRSHLQKSDDSLARSTRQFHVDLGSREKALLADDPALRRFKSHKKSVYKLKRFGDVLTIIVVAGCCYEIYVKAVMREETRKQEKPAS